MRSLSLPSPREGLRLSEEAQDEATLRQLSRDELVVRRAGDRANLIRLWEVCKIPDFRKTTQDEHTRLVGAIFGHLTQGRRRLPDDWARGQFEALDRLDGDIDALSSRLSRVAPSPMSRIAPTGSTTRRPGRAARGRLRTGSATPCTSG